MGFYEEIRKKADSRSLDLSVKPEIGLDRLMPRIEKELRELRNRHDVETMEALARSVQETDDPVLRQEYYDRVGNFPIGLCDAITDSILSFSVDPKNDLWLGKLKKAGVVIKQVYGISGGRFFQNALQIGHYYVDVANDTCDKTKEPVVVIPAAEADFENLASYQRFLEVAEDYWGFEVFPNHIFPRLAFTFPYIFVNDEGAMGFQTSHTPHVVANDVVADYAEAKQFLFDSPYSRKALSTAQIETITRSIDKGIKRGCKFNRSIAHVIKATFGPARGPREFLDLFTQMCMERDYKGKEEWDRDTFNASRYILQD